MIFTLCGMIWFSVLNNLKEEKSLPDKVQKCLIYCVAKALSSRKTQDQLILTYTKKNNLLIQTKGDLEVSIKNIDDNDILKEKDYHLLVLVILNRFVLLLFILFLAFFNLFIFFLYPLFQ